MPNLTIDGQKVIDKLRKQEIFVKLLESPLPDNDPSKNKDVEWLPLLNQLADPANQRPVKSLPPSANRASRYNPKTGRYESVTPSNVRGQSKPSKMHIKKTSVMLAPQDGQMKYTDYFRGSFPIGILFDTEECDLKGGRYVFDRSVASHESWWLTGARRHNAFLIDALRKNGKQTWGSKNTTAASANELLVCPSRESVVAVMMLRKGEPGDRMNAIYRRELIYKHLGRYVPIIFMGPNQPAKEYKQAKIDKDLQSIKSAGRSTKPISYAFYELTEALIQYNKDHDPSVHTNVDLQKVWEAIKNPSSANQNYLQKLLNSGYAFNANLDPRGITPLDVAIEYKNFTFIQQFLKNKDSIVHERQWETLFMVLLKEQSSVIYATEWFRDKRASFPDIKNKPTVFSKIILEALSPQNLKLGMVQFLLEQGVELSGNSDFYEKLLRLDGAQLNALRDILSTLFMTRRAAFLTEFDKIINQSDEKTQVRLLDLVIGKMRDEECKTLLLKPQFIFNPEIYKIIRERDGTTGDIIEAMFIKDDVRTSLINSNPTAMNVILDDVMNRKDFHLLQLPAGFYDDFPRLHQLSQTGLSSSDIDKIKEYLDKKAWSVFGKVQGLTFIETVFTQTNGKANAEKLITLLPLPKNYLEYLMEKPALQDLKALIAAEISNTETNDLALLEQLAIEGKGSYKESEFFYDRKNYTPLQYMIVTGEPDWLAHWLGKNKKTIQRAIQDAYWTKNTKESLLSLAVKQKKYVIFQLIVEEVMKQSPQIILAELENYIEILTKPQHIDQCISLLKLCDDNLLNSILDSALKQKNYQTYNLLFKEIIKIKPDFLKGANNEYLEMLIQGNQIANCINWLNSCDEELLEKIELNKISSLFVNDNLEHIKIITQTKLLDPNRFKNKSAVNLELALMDIVNAKGETAPQCVLALIKMATKIILPTSLKGILLKLNGITEREKLNIISDGLLHFVQREDKQRIKNINQDPGFSQLIYQSMIGLPERTDEFLSAQVFPHLVFIFDNAVLDEIIKNKPKEFVEAFKQYISVDDFKQNVLAISQMLTQIRGTDAQVSREIVRNMSDEKKSLFFVELLKQYNDSLTYGDFSQLLQEDDTLRAWFFENALTQEMSEQVFKLRTLRIIYSLFRDKAREMVLQWLDNYESIDWPHKNTTTMEIYFYFVTNSWVNNDEPWLYQFLHTHLHHLNNPDIFPVDIKYFFVKLAFLNDAKLCALIFMKYPNLDWKDIMTLTKTTYCEQSNEGDLFNAKIVEMSKELEKNPIYKVSSRRSIIEDMIKPSESQANRIIQFSSLHQVPQQPVTEATEEPSIKNKSDYNA